MNILRATVSANPHPDPSVDRCFRLGGCLTHTLTNVFGKYLQNPKGPMLNQEGTPIPNMSPTQQHIYKEHASLLGLPRSSVGAPKYLQEPLAYVVYL